MKMFRLNKIVVYLVFLLSAACSKDTLVTLPEGSVSFHHAAGKDTLQMPLSILKDTTLVLDLKAELSGTASKDDHWVSFAVDSNKILDYRAKYGNAILLPSSCYLFFKQNTRISAGTTISEIAQLNIGLQTKLTEYSTYVLPVVVRSVDGNPDIADGRVLYFVFKTGKPSFINKTGWEIAGFSSQYTSGTAPTMLLDANNNTTFWASSIQQQMPQWVAINFKKEIIFSGLTYYLPTTLSYPRYGGYPTSIKIETSMDGTTWESKGVFEGAIANNQQTIPLGLTSARYLRFTSLASVKYSTSPSAAYDAVFISGISLVP